MHAARRLCSAAIARVELGERGHPIVAGFEPGEDRRRCHADEALVYPLGRGCVQRLPGVKKQQRSLAYLGLSSRVGHGYERLLTLLLEAPEPALTL